jgi:hypothetical protein
MKIRNESSITFMEVFISNYLFAKWYIFYFYYFNKFIVKGWLKHLKKNLSHFPTQPCLSLSS